MSAAREAAKLIRDGDLNRKSVRPSRKGGSWVTNVDRSCEKLIARILAKKYPDYGVLGEESGLEGDPERCWVIDPLDGTTNYVHAVPDYCVSIAFVEKRQAQAGVIYDVCRDDLYTAERGKGVFLNDRRCKPSGTPQLGHALVASLGGSGSEPWMRRMGAVIQSKSEGVRRSGSSALDLAMVAAGRFGGFFGHGMRFWDYAAGALMIRENGGLMEPLDKGEFVYGKTAPFLVGGDPGVAAELRLQALRLRDEQG